MSPRITRAERELLERMSRTSAYAATEGTLLDTMLVLERKGLVAHWHGLRSFWCLTHKGRERIRPTEARP